MARPVYRSQATADGIIFQFHVLSGIQLPVSSKALVRVYLKLGHGQIITSHGPLARYVKLRVAHAPGRPGTFSPPLRVSDPDMHHGTCVTHVPWCMSGSPTSGFLWSRWRGKCSRHSRRRRHPHFCVSGKRPIQLCYSSVIKRCIWYPLGYIHL